MRSLLVVEDDARNASFLARGLRAEGYRVVLAETGAQALDHAAAESFAAILLHGQLAGATNGHAVCRQLRGRGDTTPLLMLGSRNGVTDRIEGLRVGADDYLAKPADFDELLARIAALLRRAAGARAINPRLALGDLVLDRETLVVTRGGRRVELTAKEIALLELLLDSPGRVFSRERILSSVWSVGEDPLTNVVDVYVGRLRRKLALNGQAGLSITTVRGRGYRLEAMAQTAEFAHRRERAWGLSAADTEAG